jgi:ABC-2 type transport system ATP-binding protein
MQDIIIEVRDLRKTYSPKKNPVHALRGINFTVKAGEVFGILGANGAGKSTTLNILIGLLSPTGGEVKIFGKNFFLHEEDIKQRMNIATTYADLASNLTVYRNLNVFAVMYGVGNREEKIAFLLTQFGIADLRDKRIDQLSAGEKTRVNLCKSLLNDPDILLLDEPTASLDPAVAAQTREFLLGLQQRQGTTVIFTSHNMTEVEQMCDRVALLAKGQIYKIDTPENLQKLVRTQVVTVVTGGQPKNLEEILKGEGYEPRMHKNYFEVEIANEEYALVKLLDTLKAHNIGVRDVIIEKPNLEQVFIRLAKGQIT